MFRVTTSDDYRPVAWMGRYPVDVTTMLVGIHVAAAILAAILVAFGAGLCFALAAIRQCRDLVQRPGVAAVYLCLRSCPIGAALVRHRDVLFCLSSGEKWNVFWADARISRSMLFAGHAGSATDDLGTVGTVRNCRFARVALWNIRCVRHHLSACRNVAADPWLSGSR